MFAEILAERLCKRVKTFAWPFIIFDTFAREGWNAGKKYADDIFYAI